MSTPIKAIMANKDADGKFSAGLTTIYIADLPNEDRALAPGLFAEVRLDGAAPSAEVRAPDAAAPGSAAQ